MSTRCLHVLTFFAAIVFAGLVGAHSDLEKPLFVATDGVDDGRCHDADNPCKTIGYALDRVGKGGQVRVATGHYKIANVGDLFHLVSGVVNVRGGYRSTDHFQQATTDASVLIGVPQEYRALLGSRGFHVLADGKAINRSLVSEAKSMLALHEKLKSSLNSAPCVAGQVSGLACENVTLHSHVALADVSATPSAAADVWGFVDLNTNREYAIVGYNIGTAVFDITDAENPIEVGFVDGQNTVWRDIKVHQFFNASENRWNAFAYVTTDGSSDGLFVIDLTELPYRISRRSYSGDFSAAHNIYAINTDFGTGLSLNGNAPSIIVAGSNNGGGRFRVYSLADPASPGFTAIPNVNNNDYMHDAASMIIRDSRKDSQCVNAADYCEVLFDFNESTVDVWDITNAASPVRLSRTPYTNSAYTHSGWPSEDGQFLFVHDELDEQNLGLQTTLRTFSLADLTAPVEVNAWSGPTAAIDHNGFVRGNRYYMSNYSRGLTVLDISDPAAPQPAGRLDTYPFSDAANFVGAWGAYPFFHSGNIAISDINSGLYIIADDSRDSAAGSLSFAQASFASSEGNALSITVQRIGGSTGAVSVALEIVPATGNGSDLGAQSGTLTWADGDSADKVVTIDTTVDGVSEGLERLLVKLVAPTGGATIAARSVTSLYVGDPGDPAIVEFAENTIDLTERGFAKAIVTFHRSGNATAAASVDYALSAGDAIAGDDYQGTTDGTINWPDGDADPKWIELLITDDGSGETDEFIELTLSGANGANLGATTSLRINILEGGGANQAPNANAGTSQNVQSASQVTLNGSSSNDPDGDTLTYQWTQTMGPSVNLSNANAATATFTAPSVTSDTLLQFQLQVSDPSALVDASTTNVTVSATGGSNLNGGGGGGAGDFLLLALLASITGLRTTVTRKDVA